MNASICPCREGSALRAWSDVVFTVTILFCPKRNLKILQCNNTFVAMMPYKFFRQGCLKIRHRLLTTRRDQPRVSDLGDGDASTDAARGGQRNLPAAFIHPCRPTVVAKPPSGPGWAHELKHDGYRLQIHVRDGRVRLYTMNGADWSKRYPLIIQDAARIKGSAILDAEVVWLELTVWLTLKRCTAVRMTAGPLRCAFDL